MTKRMITGTILFVLGVFLSTAKASPTIACYPEGGKHSIQKEVDEIRHHNRHIRLTKAEIRKDKALKKYHQRHGNKAAAMKKHHEVRQGKKHLRHDRRHRHNDVRNGHSHKHHHGHYYNN